MKEYSSVSFKDNRDFKEEIKEYKFVNCAFYGLDLSNVDIDSCIFEGCSFKFAQMNGSYSNKSQFLNCNFEGTNLFAATFKNCKMTGSSFVSAELSAVEFTGGNYSFVCFAGANLDKQDFSGFNLENSDFTDALSLIHI